MTRMIERWFPCAEVSQASKTGWGSGNTESSLWVWFAKRPTVQAKAAVLTSLLPWPADEKRQRELQELVRKALTGHTAVQAEVEMELKAAYPEGAKVLDPFSGRAMIPLEAGRLKARAFGVDCSPFATLGGWLLAQAPFTDWSAEPNVPFQLDADQDGDEADDTDALFGTHGMRRRRRSRAGGDRSVLGVEVFLAEVGRRFAASMTEFYPKRDGRYPWGYLWASTLPCVECGHRFPLVGELQLRKPGKRRDSDGRMYEDPGQSFRIEADRQTGEFHAVVHSGTPQGMPTRQLAGRSKYASEGKVAVCPFCDHIHPKDVHTRLSMDGQRRDTLLVAADITEDALKVFRPPTDEEFDAAYRAAAALAKEPPFGALPARPHERIPAGNTRTIQSVNYGDKTYGDLCEARQTLSLVRLARAINTAAADCLKAGLSRAYVKVLSGYATAAMMRKIRRTTRGARLQITGGTRVGDIFTNQSAVTVSYDWFESGLSEGPGSWDSLSEQTVIVLRNIRSRAEAEPAEISRGTAISLGFHDRSVDAVVTDPPYVDMIDYSDSSDLFYVWAKRAMMTADPQLSLTRHPAGVQDKRDEIIIKRGGAPANDHRGKDHFASMIERAYTEMARVVSADGIVTIVFGHGDPEVWRRMLGALSRAKLVLTGSWPAKTEAGGGGAGSANIVTTLTMACRPAPPNLPEGRVTRVESEIKAQVKSRMQLWATSGLAITDMLMASAGPAMEVAGQYSQITNSLAQQIEPERFLITARRAVREISAIPVSTLKLEDFDPRTLFALWWVRLYQRDLTPKSELRWELMAADLSQSEVKNLIKMESNGCRFVRPDEVTPVITPESAVIDIALAMAAVWQEGGIDGAGRVLALAGRSEPDEQLWAAITFLEGQLEFERDVTFWAGLGRNRPAIQQSAAIQLASGDLTKPVRRRPQLIEEDEPQERLF